jgi:D-inositol-3-phosphate glycosyltransferase
MVALEAMAMGTPVIASEVGGLAYVVRDGYNGFLVPRRDAEALAARILLLLNDRFRREHLSRQAIGWAQEYDWRNIVQQMMQVYADLRLNR